MKFIHILIALIVFAFLYLLVFERDSLLSFARGNSAAPAQTENPAAAPQTPDDNQKAETRASVVAIHSVARQVENAILLRGQTEAARQVNVMAETSGKVISEPLRKGAYVEAGQVLCRLDPGTRESSLTEAKARLTEAKARLPEAQANASSAEARLAEAIVNENAARKLGEEGYASETRITAATANLKSALAGVESAKAAVISAKAAVEAAKAAVAAIERDIANLEIKAPFEGLLETDTAELGILLQPGSPCGTILQLDPIKLVGFAPEAEVGRVSIGARAGARLATGEQVTGRVSFLAHSADPLTRTFRVEVEVPNAGLAIRDGQTVEIIVSSGSARAHLLPQSALTLNNAGDLGIRFVDNQDVVGFAPVSILRDTTKGVWVQGLDDKVDVIVRGQEYVIAGVKVDVTYQEPEQ